MKTTKVTIITVFFKDQLPICYGELLDFSGNEKVCKIKFKRDYIVKGEAIIPIEKIERITFEKRGG